MTSSEDLTLEKLLDTIFPPIEKLGYFSILPKDLRIELTRFMSSCDYTCHIDHFDKNNFTYRMVLSHKNFDVKFL